MGNAKAMSPACCTTTTRRPPPMNVNVNVNGKVNSRHDDTTIIDHYHSSPRHRAAKNTSPLNNANNGWGQGAGGKAIRAKAGGKVGEGMG